MLTNKVYKYITADSTFSALWASWVQGYIYIGSLSIDFSVLKCSMVMISPILRWGEKQRKYTFHSYKPVSWLLTHQGILLLGHSKGNARVEIPAWFFFFFFFIFITHEQPFDSDACAMFRPMSTWYDVMTDELKLSRCQISTDTVYITLKTHWKYVDIVRGRPTLKDVERFRKNHYNLTVCLFPHWIHTEIYRKFSYGNENL